MPRRKPLNRRANRPAMHVKDANGLENLRRRPPAAPLRQYRSLHSYGCTVFSGFHTK